MPRITCPECNGKGIWERDGGLVYGTCEYCKGEKTVEVTDELPSTAPTKRSHSRKKGKA